jgi:hypothetical protein
MLVFLDTEFTNFHQPQLLSIGMVSLAGEECYAELDIESMEGCLALVGASEFVRGPDVLGQWKRIPDATMSAWSMGERVGLWLLDQADRHEAAITNGCDGSADTTHKLEVCADFAGDFELLERLLRHASIWDRVRHRIRFHDIARLLNRALPDIAAQDCFKQLSAQRGIGQHHALADALAMRAGFLAVRDLEARKARR